MALKAYSEKVYIWLLVLISFTLPLDVLFNNIAIALLILYWLITANFKVRFKAVFSNRYFWIFTSIYLYQFIGILYSSDVHDALSKIEKKAGLLLFPLILMSLPVLGGRQLFYIIFAFVASCFILFTYAVFNIIATYGTLLNVPKLTEYIDDVIHLHHAYSGLYLVFCIISLVFFLNKNWQLLKKPVRAFISIIILVLYAFLIILGARMALFISFVVLGLQMVIFTLQTKSFRALAIIAVTIAIGLVGIISLPATRTKLNEILYVQGVYSPFTPRLIQWQCGVDILNNTRSWIQGVGTGDVKPLLQACYQEKKFWGHLYNYNTHNEYIEETLRHGIIGLTFLLFALLIPVINSIKQQNYLYLFFLIAFIIASLSEVFLNRQKGVIFYAFFNVLLFMHPVNNKAKV